MKSISSGVTRTSVGASLLLAAATSWSNPVTTPVEGTLGRSAQSCLQLLSIAVGESENCMYNGGPSQSTPQPFGQVTGPFTQIRYYDSLQTPQAFNASYVTGPNDGKIEQVITGSITIDDNGTPGVPDDDLISFELEFRSPGEGDVIRNVDGSGVVDRYTSMSQVLAPWPVDSATPNDHGGFDYVIGSQGFPARRQFVLEPCVGQAFGDLDCGFSFTIGSDPLAWTAAPAAGLGSLEGNIGARTTGSLENPACVDAGANQCRTSKTSLSPRAVGPNETPGGGVTAEDAGFDQLLLQVSTDAAGNVIELAGYDVQEYQTFGLNLPCGNDPGATIACNSWTAGYFSALGVIVEPGVANDDGPVAAPEAEPVEIDVLGNDTGFAEEVSVTIVTAPTKGNAVVTGSPGLAADIRIIYTADIGATGEDSLVYEVADGINTDTATVTLVTGFGARDDSAATTRNTAVNIPVGANDIGFGGTVFVDIDELSFDAGGSAVVSAGNGGPAGLVVVTYTPASPEGSPSYVETFSYTISDGDLLEATATVTVTVENLVPVAAGGTITLSTIGLSPTGRSGTFTAPGPGGTLGNTPGAVITITGQGASGTATAAGNTITYTITDAGFFSGTDAFTYTITDADGETASAEVNISIPDATPALDIWNLSVSEGEASQPTVLLPQFLSLGNGAETNHQASITSQAANGTCSLTSADATSALVYTPAAGFSGTDSCEVTVTDGDGDASSDIVNITVREVNAVDGRVGGATSMSLWSLLMLMVVSIRRLFPGTLSLRRAPLAAALIVLLGVSPVLQAQMEEIVVTARKIEERLQDVPLSITAFDSATIAAAGITNLNDVAALTPGLSFFNAQGEFLPVPVIRGVAPTDIFGQNNAAVFIDGVYVSGRKGINFSQLDVERIEIVKGPVSSLYGRNAFSGAINYVTKMPADEFEAKVSGELGNRGKTKGNVTVSGPLFGDTLTGRMSVLYDEWDGSYDNATPGGPDIGGYRFRSIQSRLRWQPTESLDLNLSYYSSNDDVDESALVGWPANCEDDLESIGVRLSNFCGRIPGIRSAPGLNGGRAIPKVREATGESRSLDRLQLTAEWDIPEFGTFSSLSGYSYTEQEYWGDFNHNLGYNTPFLYCPDATATEPGTPNACIGPADQRFFSGIAQRQNGDSVEEWSEELRFTSPQDRPVRFSVGTYYYKVERKSYDGNVVGTASLPPPADGAAAIGLPPFSNDPDDPPNFLIGTAIFSTTFTPDGGLDPLNRVRGIGDTEAWAVFGSLDFDLTDRLTARTELRYSHERVGSTTLVYQRCLDRSEAGIAECGDDVYDLRVVAAQPIIPFGDTCDAFASASARSTCSAQTAERFASVTGRLSFDYKFNDDWMVYTSVAYGEKPGGTQLLGATLVPSDGDPFPTLLPNDFDLEEITAYEVGIKGTFPDWRLTIDAAVFYNDWKNIVLRQLTESDPETGLPLEQPVGINVNAGDARVLGLELSAGISLTDNLRINSTLGWQDAELRDARQDTFERWPTFAPDGDVSGNKLLRQPEWMASLSVSYTRPLPWNDWEWFARGDGNYESGVYIGNDNQSWLPSHGYVNLRLGARSSRYTVDFWVRNLFDNDSAIAAFRDIYWTNTDNVFPPYVDQGPRPGFNQFPPLRYTVTYPRLRTYGVNFEVRFGGAAN